MPTPMLGDAQPESRGRKYRSKKQRPCDLCRSRKIQCKLQEKDAACEPCRKLRRQCTFVLEPLKRRYRTFANEENISHASATHFEVSNRQHEPAHMGIPLSQNPDPHIFMESPSFWFPLDEASRQPPTAPHSLDWPPIDLPPGLATQDDGDFHAHFAAENEHHFSSNLAAPEETTLLQTTQANNPSNCSPSTASERDSHLNGPLSSQDADSVMSDGFNAFTHQTPLITSSTDKSGASQWSEMFSLDSREGHSSQLIGLTCESDPYLLRHYVYDMYDTFRMFRLHFRTISSDADEQSHHSPASLNQVSRLNGSLPIQFVMVDEEIWKDDMKAAESLFSGHCTEQDDSTLLEKLVPPELELRLIKLYVHFVHPRYPVLCLSDLSYKCRPKRDLLPVGIRSAICALASPFIFFDDELSVSKGYREIPAGELWTIAHRSFQRSSRLSHLSLLQLCLLLLQQPPQSYVVAEPPSFWSLSCSALAIAENLGLNLDPLGWRLPQKEIKLRRRLWWLTFSTHIWQAIGCGRPSHLNDDNWDVSKLVGDDFDDDCEDNVIRDLIKKQIPICLAQTELSMIAADVLKEFYTVKGNRGPLVLNDLLNRAQPLRTRIESWRQTMSLLATPISELGEGDFEDSVTLRLSHLSLEILIFRAILRPLFGQAVAVAESAGEPVSMIFENCYTCAKVATEVVASLRSKHFASFWPPHVRYQLCSFSTFILLNLAHSPTREMAVKNKALLSDWRDTLRLQARAWPLARLAAMRLGAICWKGLSTIVHGVGPESPAVILCQEKDSQVSGDV